MIQLNWYKIFGVQIPDGSTVLPTDDIQIWLHCANIWDKNYTTLAEVLADSTTLSALISSNNAVDYLVRSTTWIGSNALVPTMTSNTTPSGECYASHSYTTSPFATWKAFNRVAVRTDGAWYDDDTTDSSPWLGYDFGYPVKITHIDLTHYFRTYSTANNMTAQLQGSNSRDSGFVDVGSPYVFSGISTSDSDLTKAVSWDVAEPIEAYRYYRLVYNQRHKNGNTDYTYVVELQYGFSGLTNDSTAMTYIGLNNYCANKLLADATWRTAICNSTYFESVLNVKIPVMTSNNTPSGNCTASYQASGGTKAAWYAFDGDSSTEWATYMQNVADAWVGYEFAEACTAYKYSIYLSDVADQDYVVLKASSDGSNFVDIIENIAVTNTTYFTGLVTKNFTLGKYIRMRTWASIAGYGKYCRELQIWGRKDV